MSRKRDIIADAPGQDSFLDVVANLVGILIILIIVIGARAKDAMVEAAVSTVATAEESPSDPSSAALIEAAAVAKRAADAVEQSINEVAAQIEQDKLEAHFRRLERDRFNMLVATGEAEIAKEREKLDASQRQQLDVENQLSAAREVLAHLQNREAYLNATLEQPAIIDHLPTPMAKTVFGKEIHFRLLNGRLTPIPWDELIARLKEDAPHQISRMREAAQITETLGPVGGFLMKYTLKRVEATVRTNVGMAVQTKIELDRFILVPTSDALGEPIEEALRPDSSLRVLLRSQNPGRTTITVWVYPDSFDHFRLLKQNLYQIGYLAAARPLPEGYPIGGSPDGTRSAVQ